MSREYRLEVGELSDTVVYHLKLLGLRCKKKIVIDMIYLYIEEAIIVNSSWSDNRYPFGDYIEEHFRKYDNVKDDCIEFIFDDIVEREVEKILKALRYNRNSFVEIGKPYLYNNNVYINIINHGDYRVVEYELRKRGLLSDKSS